MEGVGCMKVIINGKNIRVRDSIRNMLESKLQKFDKMFRGDIEAYATVSVEKNRHIVEITIPLKNSVIFRAEESTEDLYASIDLAIDKLAKQMRKHKSKIEKRFQGSESIRFEAIEAIEPEEDVKKLVRAKRFSIKPMDPEEAVLQMEMLGHDFFVFRNGDTDEVNVVYMRKDGNYGLIEPLI